MSDYGGMPPALPDVMQNERYIPGFLKSQIGKNMRVEFLIGNALKERSGKLVNVGASFIVLRPEGKNETVLCDIHCIKFVTVEGG